MEQKGVISGDPGTGRSGNLGRSRYDHTMGGTGVGGGPGTTPGRGKPQVPYPQSTLSLQMGKLRFKDG